MKGPETQANEERRIKEGFYAKYLSGKGLDIGYRGEGGNDLTEPVLPTAIGIDLDYPGYDGTTLPFVNNSQDFVFASHILEHVEDYNPVLYDWLRVVKPGGFVIICVPHRDLYERKAEPPSRWNQGHFRFYTPCTLLLEVEDSLQALTYRIESLRTIDFGYVYDLPLNVHPQGRYEIELVLQKIK